MRDAKNQTIVILTAGLVILAALYCVAMLNWPEEKEAGSVSVVAWDSKVAGRWLVFVCDRREDIEPIDCTGATSFRGYKWNYPVRVEASFDRTRSTP